MTPVLVGLLLLVATSGRGLVRARLRATCAASAGTHATAGSRVRGARRVADRGHVPTEVDAVLLLALVEAAVTTGVALPHALGAVGRAVGGASGAGLVRAGSALVLGAAWSSAWAEGPPAVHPVRDALEAAWTAGAPPVAGLRARADRLRRERRRAVRTAAARLAVHLVLPLGACFLPAFVLVGLVPVVLSLAGGLELTW